MLYSLKFLPKISKRVCFFCLSSLNDFSKYRSEQTCFNMRIVILSKVLGCGRKSKSTQSWGRQTGILQVLEL